MSPSRVLPVKFKKPSKTAVVLLAGVTISGTPCPRHFTVPFFCARRSVMMILNLSESLAKPLVMAILNMAYLSSLKNRAKLLSSYLPVSPSRVLPVKFKKPSKTAVVLLAGVTISGTPCPRHFTVPFFCARRSVMMILNLSESLAKPLVMAKVNMAYLSSLKNRAKLLSSYLPVSPSRVLPVKFKKPSKTAVVLLAGVTISGTPCPRHFTVPFFCARRSVMMILNLSESLAKPLVMAKLNMAYLSSLKNRAKLLSSYLSSYLPVSPSRVLPVKFKKPSKTAVVLLAGVTISGTPCPRHFTVPFGAEAPSGHVAQA